MNGLVRLGKENFWRVGAGDRAVLGSLGRPIRLALETPYDYPGRGPVVLSMVSDGSNVRLSEGGQLLRYLESQGMDLATDDVLAKTVFHAIQEITGVRMGSGQLFMDTAPEKLCGDLPRFVQIILELIGMRHLKYKEALVRLARAAETFRPDAQPLSTPF